MLERTAPGDRTAWVERLPEESRAYPLRRMAELEIVDVLRSGDLSAEQVADDLEGWSDWLQRRITEDVPDAMVLDILAGHGRSKRVRRQAAEGLPRLRR
ncbi:hypothetical protein E1286_20740 [Nonomuraea terrae]|uniref:HEAT repeat domain-containing protein n=1 Tax=Nonomuraea terrae TaxID=2530383 RepID=A0A4R4YQV2_9ACTN|nr:hypothetical protein [Nonomuraea terrae]TDD46529.1 hypothetical protein E1286_20740 [Nonomuraea terrae]